MVDGDGKRVPKEMHGLMPHEAENFVPIAAKVAFKGSISGVTSTLYFMNQDVKYISLCHPG